MSIRPIKNPQTPAWKEALHKKVVQPLRSVGGCLLLPALLGAPIYLPFVVGHALGWVMDAFGLEPLGIIFIVGFGSIIMGGMIGCILLVLLHVVWLDSFLERVVLEPYRDKIRNCAGIVFTIISSLLFTCCVSGGLIRSEWSKIGHTSAVQEKSGVQEERYWVTTSSGKTHNSSCRYYANSKGHFSTKGTGNNCKICGGAN